MQLLKSFFFSQRKAALTVDLRLIAMHQFFSPTIMEFILLTACSTASAAANLVVVGVMPCTNNTATGWEIKPSSTNPELVTIEQNK